MDDHIPSMHNNEPNTPLVSLVIRVTFADLTTDSGGFAFRVVRVLYTDLLRTRGA
uniref:Uncharacterized protein n=1 Tax=Oryza sativa subsp. japonica TaxID=39947 RepID=Q6Z428_ORYSJ|nr:hypothetical protein [Oryza sativa Japonica Group]